MRGVYDANIKISGLSSNRTLLSITAPSGKCVEILSAEVTDCSNATNQQLDIGWQEVASGSPTATTLTPTKSEQGDQAAASTVLGNVTADDYTYTSNTIYARRGVPSLTGYRWEPDEKERLVIGGGATWGLVLFAPSSPTAQDTIVAVRFREIG